MSYARKWKSVLERATPEPNTGCWLWGGAVSGNGYGNVFWEGRYIPAHRRSWEERNGPIPEGMSVLHKCDVRLCINPDHLFIGTQQENMDDMAKKGRRGHMWLTPDDVAAIRSYPRTHGSQKVIARRYGISVTHVAKIRSGKARANG